jgi:hypothetical protein
MKSKLLTIIIILAAFISCSRNKDITMPNNSKLIGTTWAMTKINTKATTFNYQTGTLISIIELSEILANDSCQYLQFLNSTTVQVRVINGDTILGTYTESDTGITISLDSSHYWYIHNKFSLFFKTINDTSLYLYFPYLAPTIPFKYKDASLCPPPIVCNPGFVLSWINLYVGNKPENLYTHIVSTFVDSTLTLYNNDSLTVDTASYSKKEYFYQKIH